MPKPLINITRKQAIFFAFFLVLYEFLTYIANDMIMPGMLKVVQEFHAPESAIATSLTAYMLGGATLQLLLGPLSDRYGRRPVMLFGAWFFFICTVAIACSQSINQFLIGRFFEGMGMCFICVIGYSSLQEIFAEMDAIRVIAIMANVGVSAPLIGPLAGAAFTTYHSWRLLFIMIALFSLLAVWGLWRYMPEPVGAIKHDGEIIKPSVLSAAVVWENYKSLLANKSFILGTLAYGLLGLPCLVWIALAPVIMVSNAKLSLMAYALWQIPVFGGAILGNILLTHMSYKFSLTAIKRIGSVITLVSLLSMYLLPLILGNQYIWLMPGLIVYFVGYGVVVTPLNRFILFATNVSKGTASALLSMLYMFVQAIGIEVVNYLYVPNHFTLFGFYCGFIGIVFFILMGILNSFSFKEKEN